MPVVSRGRKPSARRSAARAFAWKEIEIVGRPKPSVRLSGRIAAVAEQTGTGAIDLSMTHSRELAQAVAVASDA